MSILYLVPTPIGDPEDITLRALRVLRETSVIAAPERAAAAVQALLDRHAVTTPMIAYDAALDALNSGDVALVAREGTPGLGGAAHELVGEAIARGVRVEALPGASVEITALVLSGLPTDAFVYAGRLPDDLSIYAAERETLIFKAFGLGPDLERLYAAWGDRAICVVVAPTQSREIIYRGSVRGALEYFMDVLIVEALLVVAGAPEEIPEVWDEARVRSVLRERLAGGVMLKAAAKAVAAAAGWDRRAVYALGVDEKRNRP